MLHERSHAVQGGVVFLLLAVGAVTQVLLFRFDSRRVALTGLGLLLTALAVIVAALSQAGMALFLAGTIVGGIAVGALFLGSLATANRLAPPGRLREGGPAAGASRRSAGPFPLRGRRAPLVRRAGSAGPAVR